MAKLAGVNADNMGFVRSVQLLLANSCDSADIEYWNDQYIRSY